MNDTILNADPDALADAWLSWKRQQPASVDTSIEAFVKSQEPKKGMLQRINDFLGQVGPGLTRFDAPPDYERADRQYIGGAEAAQAGENLAAETRAAHPGADSLGGLARPVGAAFDAPGETKYADVVQQSVENLPRTALAALYPPALIADMGLQGYAGAKDTGASTPQALGAGAVGAATGAIMPAFARSGASAAAQGLARTPIANAAVERVGEAVGSNLAMLVPQMAQKPATELVTGRDISDPISTENLLETGLGNIALAPLSVHEVLSPRRHVAADGRVIEYPSYTALERSQLYAEKAKTRESAMERLYAQFMLGADEAVSPLPDMTGPPTLGQTTARLREKAYETIGTLDENQLVALRPLEGLMTELKHADTLQQEAHDSFVKAAGLDVPASKPEFSLKTYAGEDLGDPKTLTPAGILDRIIAGELVPTGGQAARVVGAQKALDTGNDIANVDLLRRVFGPRALAGEDFVDMDRVNSLATLAARVMNAPKAGESAEALPAHLQGQAQPGREELSAEDQAAWEKLDNTTKQAAVVAAKILQDPYSVLGKNTATGGLDPARWTTTEPNYLRVVHDLSATLYKRWDKPITDVETAGALVRDVNFFIENVRGFLEQNGFGEESLKQLQGAGLRPLTVEHINEQYNKAAEQYLSSPTAEAAAQTLQWVKNKILLTAQDAKRTLETRTGGLEPGRIAQNRAAKEKDLEAEFMGQLQGTPAKLQGLLEGMYNIHRAERTDKKGDITWKLDDFRRSVTRSIAKLTPEQKAKLESLPNLFKDLDRNFLELYQSTDRSEIPALLRKQATDKIDNLNTASEIITRRSASGEDVELSRRSRMGGEPVERAEDDDTALVTGSEKTAAKAKLVDKEYEWLKAEYDRTVAEYARRREAIKPVLEQIPAVRVEVKAEKAKTKEVETRSENVGETKEEETVEPETVSEKGSNLYKVIFEPVPSRVMDARRGGMNAQMSLDQPTGESGTTVGERMSGGVDAAFKTAEEMKGSDEEGAADMQGGETAAEERVATVTNDNTARDNRLVEQYFQGTPKDPHEVLAEMKPLQLEAAISAIFSEKTWKNLVAKASSVLGQTPNEVRKSGAAVEWVKDFLRADLADDGSPTREDWRVKNAAVTGEDRNWQKIRRNVLGTDPAKLLMLKARLLGLEPKEGVSADTLYQATKTERAAPRERKVSPKFEYDVRTAFNQHFLAEGYQPELAKTLSDTLSKMTKNFTWLDNAEFAMLTDKRATADKFLKDLQVLGVHIPTNSMVGGKSVSNPIIALAFNDFIKNKDYAAFNGFLKISTLAHEAFHAFKANVVDNPEVHRFNEDTQAQVAAYRQMEKLSMELNPEDRARIAASLVDLMIPPKFVRGKDGSFLPEVRGIINGATRNPQEFMAFYYQIVATGLAAKVAAEPTSRRGMNEVRDAMQWLSRDEQNFVRGQFRHVGDMLDALQQTLDNPEYRRSQGYVKKETEERTVVPSPESQQKLTVYGEGQASQFGPEDAKTKKVPFEYAVPPTKDVGLTARSLAGAAEKIATGGALGSAAIDATGFGAPGSIQQQVNRLKSRQAELQGEIRLAKGDGDVIYPAQQRKVTEMVQELAKIDKRVEKAEAQLRDMETFANPSTVADRIASGQLKKIDVSEIEGNKDFFIALFGKPPQAPPPKWMNEGFYEGDQPAFTRSVVGRFLAKFQPQQFKTYDLMKRGLPIAEKIRQTLDRIQPEAHKINHSIMDPIVSRFGNFESVRLNTTKDFFRFLSDDGKKSDPVARKALNEILSAQQALEGLDVLDPQMQPVLQKALASVPPPKRALVVTAVRTVNEIYANRADAQLKMAAESQLNAIAALSMKMVPGQASDLVLNNAKQAIAVSESGDLAAHQAFVQNLVNQKYSPAQADALLRVAAAGYVNVMEMSKRIQSMGKFASEQRVGEFILSYSDANGDRKSIGIADEVEGKRKQKELAAQGASNFHKLSKAEMSLESNAANSYKGMVAVDDMIRENFNKQLAALQAVDPNLAEYFQREFNPTTSFAEYKAISSAQKNMLKRELKGGRESADYVETMFDNISRTSISLARRSARERFELLNTELDQMGNREMATEFKKQLAEVMTPDSPVLNKVKTTVTGWLVPTGANFILEMGQMLSSGNTMLYREGLGTKQIAGLWKESIESLVKWKFSKSKEFGSLADDGQRIETARYSGQPLLENRDATVAFYLRRMNDEARMGHEALMDLNGQDLLYTNLARASRQNNFNWMRPDELAGNMMYQSAKMMLRWYSVAPRFNNWAASNAALRVAYDKGLRGNELYTYAISLKDTMTIAGGRANKPSMFAVPGSGAAATVGRSAVAMTSMLSNYALGSTTLMASNIKDATMGAQGLNPTQRLAAGKAATNALLAQLSLAGALGMPFAGALVWAVEQLTKSDAEKAMRELARLGQDDGLGEMYSDMAMNGWVNRASGADLASKAGVNSFFGINGYNGFDPVAMFGPTGTVVKDMWSAAELATEGKGMEALAKFVPRGLRGAAEMAASGDKYGDLRVMDNSNNLLYKPGAGEALGMALGFQPSKVKEAKQKARLVEGSEKRFAKKDTEERDQLALALLKGDSQSLIEVMTSRMGDQNFDAKEYIRSVVERAADMQVEKDPTDRGSRGNMKARGEINALLPSKGGQEQERYALKAQLLAQLGNPMGLQMTQKDLLRAMVVDEMRSQDTKMTRQEALINAEKMLGN